MGVLTLRGNPKTYINKFYQVANSNNHGGVRPGQGRKSKAEELGLIGKLSPMEPDFLKALANGLKEGNPMLMKMFAEYFYGKPKDQVDLTSGGEVIKMIFQGTEECEPMLNGNGNGTHS